MCFATLRSRFGLTNYDRTMSSLLLLALAAPPPAVADLLTPAAPLDAAGTVLVDGGNRRVLVKAEVCLRRGALEMLLCLPNTKEHESVLKFEGDARTLHAALVAIGLEPGEPVTFSPEFAPPRGPVLDLTAYWTGPDGTPRAADARTFVRTSTEGWYERPLAALPAGLTLPPEQNLRYDAGNKALLWYGRMDDAERAAALALTDDPAVRAAVEAFYVESQPRPLTADFVFAGSGFYAQQAVGEDGTPGRTVTRYAAEGGEVVCVANFPSATIDIAERSSAEGQGVLYEAATGAVPPEGTSVLLAFTPRPEKPAAPAEGTPAPAGDGEGGAGPAGSGGP